MSCVNIAHRGASRQAPENTVEAFELAVAQGAHMIETDLHLTRDGQVVLVHDDEIGGAPIGELSLEQIHEMRPDAPTLEQLLDGFGDRIRFNLEFKRPRSGAYPGLEAHVLREVERRDLVGPTLFSCFYDPVLATLRGLSAKARIGLLISRRAPIEIEKRARALGAEAIHPELELVTTEMVRSAHHVGFKVHVFTADDRDDQSRLLDMGVDGIFTNLPGQLRDLLSERG
jgi:glycerophosphoryl diester phosphodiesterase